MNATQQLIAIAMDRLQAKTQRELAAKLGLSHGMVAFYVSGRSSMKDPANIANVCLLIGEEPQKWFAAIAAEDSGEARVKTWARKLGVAAALAVTLFPLGNAKANTIQVIDSSSALPSNAYYVKRRRRWLARSLRRIAARLLPSDPVPHFEAQGAPA